MASDQTGAAASSRPQRTAMRMSPKFSRILPGSMRRHARRHRLVAWAMTLLLAGSAGAQGGVETYRGLAAPQLDPRRVYLVRDREIEIPGIHLTLHSGTIAFAQPQRGRIAYAYFE